jgi:hypothetical protein
MHSLGWDRQTQGPGRWWLLVLLGLSAALACGGPSRAAPSPTPSPIVPTATATRTLEPWQRTATAEARGTFPPTVTPTRTPTRRAILVTPRPSATPTAPATATPTGEAE